MKYNKESLLLYAVTDRAWIGKQTLIEQVKDSLDGGATFIQLREKELDDGTFLDEARKMKSLCKEYNVPFVINDNIDIAIECDADGVHVGQSDMDALNVKKRLGKDKIIGVSAQTVEQAIIAQNSGADYLGVGAVFSTLTKLDADTVSFETLKQICDAVSIPVIAIGGIYDYNILKLSKSGIVGIAVVSAIFAQDNIKQSTANLLELATKMVKAE
ncbi:thiamine phosphate synthase [Proteocatella sphenisci]|uniref:thiamine phosphate synthase n=1 Tax=Proteocatella sphenisci TaxID=181070 RepID=UPI00048FFBE3|nr:thiamine phosphate synthase [Proteocatella sphenisci]